MKKHAKLIKAKQTPCKQIYKISLNTNLFKLQLHNK